MRERLWATVAIWAAFAIAAVALVAEFASRSPKPITETTLIGLMALLVVGTVAGTRVVWHSRCQEREADLLRAQQARLERLEERYTEEELLNAQRSTVISRRSKD